MLNRRQLLFVGSALGVLSSVKFAKAETIVRVAALKLGTVSWELDTIIHHGFDKKHGITLSVIPVAGKQSADVMLAGGEADVIVTDWLWVSRQRSQGADYTFFPFSRQVGSILVQADSPVKTLSDLKGKKIGVAGGPTDKSWILLCALAKKELDLDLSKDAEPVFAAPLLLNEQFQTNSIDALVTFWNYAAILKSTGAREIVSVADAAHSLGLDAETPLLGYVFSQNWSKTHENAAAKLAAASLEAKALLSSDDEEWQRLRPLMNVKSDREFNALKEGFRAGIPEPKSIDRAAALRLYALLTAFGGRNLVGDTAILAEGTFADD